MTLFWVLLIIYVAIFISLWFVYYLHYRHNVWERSIMPFKPCPFYQGDYDFQEMKTLGTRKDRQGIITYSLYGNYNKYAPTLLKSIENIKRLLPEWQARIYVGIDIPKDIKKEILAKGGEIIIMGPEPPKGHDGALWRFLALENSDKEPFVSLDADDLFDQKIVNKIKSWFESGLPFCTLRPIILTIPMSAGLWGCRNFSMPDLRKKIAKYCEYRYGFDEMFLKKEIWPIAEQKGCWTMQFARFDLILPYLYFFVLILIIFSLYLAWYC